MRNHIDALSSWIVRRLPARSAPIVTLLVGLSVVALMAKASGEIYEDVAAHDELAAVDHPLLQAALATRTPFWDRALTGFTTLGGPIAMSIIALVCTVLLARWQRSWTPVILMASAVAGSLVMTIVGKRLVARARPPLRDAVPPYETSPSFPSGHTLNSTVIAGVVAYVVIRGVHRRWLRTLALLGAISWALAMGASRVWLGHHWFTDVAVGWTLGLLWLAVVITTHQVWLRATQPPPTSDPAPTNGREVTRQGYPTEPLDGTPPDGTAANGSAPSDGRGLRDGRGQLPASTSWAAL